MCEVIVIDSAREFTGSIAAESGVGEVGAGPGPPKGASPAARFIVEKVAFEDIQVAEIDCGESAAHTRLVVPESRIVQNEIGPVAQRDSAAEAIGRLAEIASIGKCYALEYDIPGLDVEYTKTAVAAYGMSLAVDGDIAIDRRQRLVKRDILPQPDDIGAIAGWAGARGRVRIGGDDLIRQRTGGRQNSGSAQQYS